MSDDTPRLRIPELVSMQEANCATWNEALVQLDAFVDLHLLGQYVDTPPASPADGDAYLLGGSPTGAWSGYAYKIAYCIDGAWRFYIPFNGLRAYVATTGAFIVYVNGTWTDWNSLISANEVSIASAATCDLGAAGSLFVQITGNTTITSFGTGTNKLRFVRFAQALTLTHNATSLILLGGASRTTAANDVGIYASDANGNWRERSYFYAASAPGGGGGGSGTVTSVGLSMPAEFNVSGSPVTGSGTLTATKANQSANLVYAGPASGSAAAPGFRTLVAADIPALGYGSVSSVGLALDSGLYTVSGSPMTGSGTLTGTLNTQSANLVFAGPASGSAAKPTFRALAAADLPAGTASLSGTSQAFSGGLHITTYDFGTASSGTKTVNQGNGPQQKLVNGGAFTLAAPAQDGNCLVLVTNNASAGAITFSGFTVGSNTGDTLTTTNTNKFLISIITINGVSTYLIKALQ
jgi:hypothetical protein